jgi:beta-glucosidase
VIILGISSRFTPITFPANLAQTPRPELSGLGTPWGTPTTIRYDEGAEVGYRWFANKNEKPLYAFGYGLSYTSFSYSDLKLSGGETITAGFTVTNTGKRDGADVPQLYLTEAGGRNVCACSASSGLNYALANRAR